MSDFFVGQQVVCLCGDWESVIWWRRKLERFGLLKTPNPQKGKLYTISSIDVDEVGEFLALSEIEKESYISSGFRPLDSNALEVFRKIARDVTEGRKVEVRA